MSPLTPRAPAQETQTTRTTGRRVAAMAAVTAFLDTENAEADGGSDPGPGTAMGAGTEAVRARRPAGLTDPRPNALNALNTLNTWKRASWSHMRVAPMVGTRARGEWPPR